MQVGGAGGGRAPRVGHDQTPTRDLLSLEPLHDRLSAACVFAERAMLAALDGSCRTPIAGLAEVEGDRLTLEGLLLKPDGSGEIRGRLEGGIDGAEAIGTELGKELRGRAGPGFGLA